MKFKYLRVKDITLDAALEWQATQDKFVYCLELLMISMSIDGEDYCDREVEKLESRFKKLLDNEHVDAT